MTLVRPGLYPKTGPRPGCTRGERALWEALSRRLPEGWYAWHSVRIRGRSGDEGEGDFVLAIPGRGVLVIEAKDGTIEVIDGVWHQNRHVMRPPTREQAHQFRRLLGSVLGERGVRHVWIDVATAFPTTPFLEPPTHGDVRHAVVGQQDLAYIDAALEALVDRLFFTPGGARAEAPEGVRWIDELHALWGDTWVRFRRLGDRHIGRATEILEFDSVQRALLDAFEDNPRTIVRGGPGTGKTVIAMELARRRAARGERCTVVCFTRALAAWLRGHGIDAASVRELAADVLLASGARLSDAPRDTWQAEIWDTVCARALAELPREVLGCAGFCVVDEAQDFTADDWAFAQALAGEGPLWVFGDDGQAFWPDRLKLDPGADGFSLVTLRESYRTPKGLEQFANQYRPGAAGAPLTGPLEGLRVVAVAGPEDLERAVTTLLAQAAREGLGRAQQALLGLGGRKATGLASRDRVADRDLRRADAPDAHAHTVGDTFLRFKGLERPLVIVTELSRGAGNYDVRMYIALTRATVECVVVATASEIAADPRLAAALGSYQGDDDRT